MSAFQKLIEYNKDTVALEHIAGRLGWDQETVMPSGSIADRSEEFAALEKTLHARRTSSELGELLSAAAAEAPEGQDLRHMSLIQRDYDRTHRIPEDLAIAMARITPKAHKIWASAREDEDFAAFASILSEVVDLSRQKGEALADGSTLSAYDGLHQAFEPDSTAADIEAMFSSLRGPLVELRAAVLEQSPPSAIKGHFDKETQFLLSKKLAETFGYDFSRGRIDAAVHPFSSGSSADVRITTRAVEHDPMNCFYSTIHEVGHATYEQNIKPEFAFTAFGCGCSLGIHESQSRIYENQLGRSRGFTSYLYGLMKERFDDFGIPSKEEFYKAVNRVSDGYIRTEADELQYNLHVMLRFDLEKSLISGDLAVNDLEAAWNERFLADFGYPVDKPSNGVLQDVHWSEAMFGYFPTYSLGNVYAGCLYEALITELGDIEADLARGDLSRPLQWLSEHLQQFGRSRPAHELIETATGKAASVTPLVTYIQRKFSDLYAL